MKQSRKLWLKISIMVTLLALILVSSVLVPRAVAASADVPNVTIEWSKISPMSKPRHSGATVVVDGTIYTIGGIEIGGAFEIRGTEYPMTTCALVEAYDPNTDTWTTKASLPHLPEPPSYQPDGRKWLAAAVYQGKIYTFGGANISDEVKDSVDVYDIASDTWTADIAKLPKPAVGMSAMTYGDKIYLFGGSASTDFFKPEKYYYDCYEFDPTTATIISKEDMPNLRFGTSTTVFNNKILVFGGISAVGNGNAQLYDPAADSWSFMEVVNWERLFWSGDAINDMVILVGGRDEHAKTSSMVNIYSDQWEAWLPATDMLTPREDAFAAAVDGKLYVMGGRDNKGNPQTFGTALSSAERAILPLTPPTLDLPPPPTTEVTIDWSFRSPMPTPRVAGATTVVDNIIYTIGGLESESPTGKVLEAYDPAADRWTAKAPLPEARVYLAAAAYEGKIYTFGGVDAKLQAVDTIDVYDIASDTWTANIAKLPKPAVGMTAVTYGDKIYLFGGSQSPQQFVPHTYYYDSVYAFDPVILTLTPKAPLSQAGNMAFGCVLGDTIHIIGGMHSPGGTGNNGYSPGNNTWQEMPPMPEMRGGHGGAVVKEWMLDSRKPPEDIVFILGGRGAHPMSAQAYNTAYDPITRTWKGATPNLIAGRSYCFTGAAKASPESMYVIGGVDSKGNVLGSVEKGTNVVAEVPTEPEPTPSPEPEPAPAPPLEPEPTPAPEPEPSPEPAPPTEGMGCARTASSLPRASFDFSPFLLGVVWVGAALALGSQRKRNK